MPLIGFSVFKDKILNGSKTQTICKLRKYPIKKGDRLHLYWHLRQKDCEFLGTTVCSEVMTVTISQQYFLGKQRLCLSKFENNEWQPLSSPETFDIAIRDGFQGSDEMLVWFTTKYPLPETFQIIRWENKVEAKK